jgi:hypothetical protein
MRLNALSISRSVRTGSLAEEGVDWRMLAAFERACNLATPGGDVVALVLAGIGDGPLNVVVDGWPGVFAAVEPGAPVQIEEAILSFSDLEIRLDQATAWEPRPDWERLRRNRERIEGHLPLVRGLALRHAPADSLLVGRTFPPYSATAWAAAEELRAGWGSGGAADKRLEAGAARLAGLGGGLTPAGDDFLAGLMLRAWLTHPAPGPFCRILLEAAAPRTTTLSAALLRAAARGECPAPWHHLLDALQDGSPVRLTVAVREILAQGHTSGADSLGGFLWKERSGEPRPYS